MKKIPFTATRENHLDHMVKVVPLIVGGYAVQCYFILNVGHTGFAADSLLFLGLCLGSMIAGFITYNLKHKVEFGESHIEVKFFNSNKKICYNDISKVDLSHEGQAFTTVILTMKNGSKYRFYFLDDGDKIKACLTEQKYPEQKAA